MSAVKERVLNLLAAGLPASEVATVIGCSPSYISQLSKEPDFAEALKNRIIAANEESDEQKQLDKRYETTEHLLLNAVKDKIPEASMGEVIRALEVIDKRKDSSHKRKNPGLVNPIGPAVNVNIVQLALPQQVLKTIPQAVVQTNSQNEIVAIDGRALAPMSSDGVKNLFSQIQNVRNESAQIAAEI
jgi:hypothetical protein